MRTPRHAGQAAVEGVGLVVAIALLVGAAAIWLAGAAQPPGSPPDAIGRVARPLGGQYDPHLWTPSAPSPFLSRPLGLRAPRPIGRAVRAIGSGVATGIVVGFEARRRFYEGFGDRLRERGRELLRDPLGTVGQVPDADLFTTRGIAQLLLERSEELWDYARFLRTLSPRVAITTAAYDAGEVSADLAIQAARGGLRRRILRRDRGGVATPPREPSSAHSP